MISKKKPRHTLNEKESDQYYSELYFELNDNPAQLENFSSNLVQENIIDFEITVCNEKIYQNLTFWWKHKQNTNLFRRKTEL